MEQARLIRIAFLTIAVAAILGVGAFQSSHRGSGVGFDAASEEESEWERFSERCASVSLRTLATAESDFRGCGGEWIHVDDFWTADITGLYTMTSAALQPSGPPTVEDRSNDRDGCHVNDFWTAEVRGLYTLTGRADSAIKLIELSVASADADEESPD
jgi:hypothetical protein